MVAIVLSIASMTLAIITTASTTQRRRWLVGRSVSIGTNVVVVLMVLPDPGHGPAVPTNRSASYRGPTLVSN